MNIYVCIKQVPETCTSLDDNGILDRRQGGSRLNPWDSYALEAALRLKDAGFGSVTALTMGPPSAEQVLKTAFSMGADRGILLTDPAFAGADVYATAYTLKEAIKTLGEHALVICGQQSADGDTAQLPFSLGAQLGIPAVGWVKDLKLQNNQIVCCQELSLGTQEARISGPAVLAVGAGIGKPRIPSLKSQLAARKKKPQVLTLQNLGDRDPGHYGMHGSHTRVVSVKMVEKQAKNPPLSLTPQEGAMKILALLKEVQP